MGLAADLRARAHRFRQTLRRAEKPRRSCRRRPSRAERPILAANSRGARLSALYAERRCRHRRRVPAGRADRQCVDRLFQLDRLQGRRRHRVQQHHDLAEHLDCRVECRRRLFVSRAGRHYQPQYVHRGQGVGSTAQHHAAELGGCTARSALTVRISRFSGQLALLSGTSQKVVFDDVKSDGLFVEPNSAKSITINDYVDTGMFFLSVGKWLPQSELQLHTADHRALLPCASRCRPKSRRQGLSFPVPIGAPIRCRQLKQWAAASSEYTPGLYTGLAASYLDGGQSGAASDILIAKQNADYAHSDSPLEKIYLFVTLDAGRLRLSPRNRIAMDRRICRRCHAGLQDGRNIACEAERGRAIGWSLRSTPLFQASN